MTDLKIGERKCRVYWEPRVNRYVAETEDKQVGAVGMTVQQAIEFLGAKLTAVDAVLQKELGS